VLHVDDNSDELRFTKLFLFNADPAFQVESVSSPEEALSILQREHFDCIVSDYKMPGMDGVELAHRIRETKDTPYIIYTGRGSEEVAEAAFAAGADDYVRKELEPSHYQVLARRIRMVVEKSRANKKLRESEERYRRLTERSRDTIFLMDPEGHITYVSPSSERIFGHSPEEIEGKTLQNFTPESEISKVEQMFSEISINGDVDGLQLEFLSRDGSLTIVEIDAFPIMKDGEVVEIQGVFRDITKHKHMEEERNRLLRDYGERIKELNCLYGISKVAEKTDAPLEEIMQGIVDLIPPAWQYPEVTCARIVFDEHEFQTDNFKETPWRQSASISLDGEKIGFVEVFYLEEMPESIEGLFLKEERHLINNIAERLSQIIERVSIEDRLRNSEERMKVLHRYAVNLGTAKTIEEVAKTTFNAVENILGFNIGGFGVVEGDMLRFLHIRGVRDHARDEVFELPLDGGGITVRAVRTGETQLVGDTRLDEDFVLGLAEGAFVTLSELAVPVKIGGKVVAIVNVESTELGAFTEDDRRLLEIFAGHIASTVSRIRHFAMLTDSEKQLQDSEDRLRHLIEYAPDAIYVNDLNGKFLDGNRQAEALIGYKREELMGKSMLEVGLLPEEYVPQALEGLEKNIHGERAGPYEFELIRKDGSRVTVEISSFPVKRAGKVEVIGIARDITERKKIEKESRALVCP